MDINAAVVTATSAAAAAPGKPNGDGGAPAAFVCSGVAGLEPLPILVGDALGRLPLIDELDGRNAGNDDANDGDGPLPLRRELLGELSSVRIANASEPDAGRDNIILSAGLPPLPPLILLPDPRGVEPVDALKCPLPSRGEELIGGAPVSLPPTR